MKKKSAAVKWEKETKEALKLCHKALAEVSIFFEDEEIRQDHRNMEFIFKRALIVFILRQKGYTYKGIGRILIRAHSTVIRIELYSSKKIGRDERFEKIKKELLKYISITDAEKKLTYHRARIRYHQSEIRKLGFTA